MFAALALVLLVSSVAEGRIMGKCELKNQLVAALGGSEPGNGTIVPGNGTDVPGNGTIVPGNGTDVPVNGTNVSVNRILHASGNGTVPANDTVDLGLIAEIVCSVERTSKFNTKLVTTVREHLLPPRKPAGRPASSNRHSGQSSRRPGRHIKKPQRPSGGDSREDSSSEEVVTIATLFGIFQLSDRVACSSGSVPSLDICHMNCNALLDDDISEDIICLENLLDTNHFQCVDECRNISPAHYFAQCV